jgi:hypothetical protein
MSDPYRAAALAYAIYGLVYLVGGLYLISQGVGVMGAPTSGATTQAMMRWGVVGLLPLVAIPWLLSRPWTWFGGLVSRRTFAWLVAGLLAIRAFKVGEVALRGGASAAAPWGGQISFRVGAAVFLVFTLMALVSVVRAAATPRRLIE